MTAQRNNLVSVGPRQWADLTPRQRLFVDNPLALTDPERAALESGYSEAFIKGGGAAALRREFRDFIADGDTAKVVREAVTPESVSRELTAAAMANMLDYFEVVDDDRFGGGASRLTLKQNLKALPPEVQRNIKELEFDTTVLPDGTAITFVAKIKLHDRTWALKEFVEILRLRDGGLPADNTNDLLRHMPAKDLAILEEIFKRAADRANDARRDQNAIEAKP